MCYDRAVAEFQASIAAHDTVVIDREALKRERKRQFGRVERSDPAFAAALVAEPRKLSGRVTSVQPAAQFLVIAIDGAGVWQTTEESFMPPTVGMTVTISKGSLGGYIISYGSRGVRARRIG